MNYLKMAHLRKIASNSASPTRLVKKLAFLKAASSINAFLRLNLSLERPNFKNTPETVSHYAKAKELLTAYLVSVELAKP